jgi:hypothetical protein
VEGENFTGAGLWITAIGEARDDACALIDERQRFFVVHPFKSGGGIAPRLLFDHGDLVAPVIGFGLDQTNSFRGNEKDIVSRADIGLVLANSDPKPCTEIDCPFVLSRNS